MLFSDAYCSLCSRLEESFGELDIGDNSIGLYSLFIIVNSTNRSSFGFVTYLRMRVSDRINTAAILNIFETDQLQTLILANRKWRSDYILLILFL